MKKRNPIAVAIFGLITFGIYGLYWLASTRKTLVQTTKLSVPSIWVLIVPFIVAVSLYAVAFIPLILSAPASEGSELPPSFMALFAAYGLAIFLMAIVQIYWFFKYSRAVDAYTDKQMSTAISFILLYLLNFIGMALIQDAFNNHADKIANEPNAS